MLNFISADALFPVGHFKIPHFLWRSEFLTHLCPPGVDPPTAQHFVDFRCDLGDASRDSFGADGFQMVRAVGVNVRVGRDGPAVALRYVVL